MADQQRPEQVFDPGLQQERTALAWERTAIASMVAGVLLARYSAEELHVAVAAFGIVQVVLGALLLIWTGAHYDDLHGPLRAGDSPVHPLAARIVGIATVCFSGTALIVAIAIALR